VTAGGELLRRMVDGASQFTAMYGLMSIRGGGGGYQELSPCVREGWSHVWEAAPFAGARAQVAPALADVTTRPPLERRCNHTALTQLMCTTRGRRRRRARGSAAALAAGHI
jgi:hypothetical protein